MRRAAPSATSTSPSWRNSTTSIQSGDVDVYSGESDKLLRRLQLSFDLKPPAGTPGAPDSLTFDLQLNLADVEQAADDHGAGERPASQNLLQQHGLNLGNALRGGLGTGGALPESGGSTTAPSASGVQAYEQCLSQASGTAELQKCADLLTK